MSGLPAGRAVRCEGKEFNFSFAASMREMIKGLGGVKSIEPFDGMLFDFSSDTSVIMEPRGLLFPIDIAFITSDGRVDEIQRMDPAIGHNVYASRQVRYAIEAPVGFFEKQNIKIGSRFSF